MKLPRFPGSGVGSTGILLTVILLLLPSPHRAAGSSGAHPLYLTVGKIQLTGRTAVLDIRIFWDDLELGVRAHSGDPAARVRGESADLAAVEAYINQFLVLEFDGAVARGRIQEWSLDGDANQYIIRYELAAPPRELRVQHRILLDQYLDQRNILHLQRDGGRERAFYFARRAEQQRIRL